MARALQKTDIDRIADIWLNTNLKAHYFISDQYWKRNFELVKEMLLQAEVYVYENDQKNIRAICFYQREGFEIQCEGIDEATGEKEYVMQWQQKGGHCGI